jgi:hypothetical protein
MREATTGLPHPWRVTVPPEVVVQLRDLHEHPTAPVAPNRLAAMFAINLRTVKSIIYYQRRHIIPIAVPSEAG